MENQDNYCMGAVSVVSIKPKGYLVSNPVPMNRISRSRFGMVSNIKG